MFKVKLKSCYKKEQNCSITQITNYENDLPYHIRLQSLKASELCDVEVVELVDDKKVRMGSHSHLGT